MEPEGSLPHSQVPATCPYPQPDQSSPCPCLQIPLPEDPSEYYPPIYAWVFQVVSFPSGFPTKTLYTPLLYPIRPTPAIDVFRVKKKLRWPHVQLCLVRANDPVISNVLSGSWRSTAALNTPHNNVTEFERFVHQF